MSAYEMLAIGAAAALGLAVLAFWAAMIYDCATRTPPRSKERYVWLLIVVLGKLPGALAYYLLVKRPAQVGPGTAARTAVPSGLDGQV